MQALYFKYFGRRRTSRMGHGGKSLCRYDTVVLITAICEIVVAIWAPVSAFSAIGYQLFSVKVETDAATRT